MGSEMCIRDRLIGVTSFWHGLTVFLFSLIAILCFTAATQGWLVTKLKLHEILALLVVTVSLFRPDIITGALSPEYVKADITETNNIDAKNSNVVRFKVIRNTEYGDRYKLFTFKVEGNEIINLPKYLGFALRKVENGYLIDSLDYNGRAKKKGLDFDDRLTSIEYQNPDLLNKYWGYVFGLVVLLILLMEQFRRRRKKLVA